MNAVRIRKKIDSETLHLPELRPLMGKTVEITVTEEVPEVAPEFWAELGRLPESPAEHEAQLAIFRKWRADPRFEVYWQVLGYALERTFEDVKKWKAAAEAADRLTDYDFDAWRRQRDYDAKHAGDHVL